MDMPKGAPYVGGKRIYERILIRRKPQQGDQRASYNQPDTTLLLAAEDPEKYNRTGVSHTPSK